MWLLLFSSLFAWRKNKFNNERIVLGFAIGFPGTDNKVIVKYRANARKLKELAGDVEEDEVEEVYGEE